MPEVSGVISRICPAEASDIFRDVLNTEMCLEENWGIYLTATELSIRLMHYLSGQAPKASRFVGGGSLLHQERYQDCVGVVPSANSTMASKKSVKC